MVIGIVSTSSASTWVALIVRIKQLLYISRMEAFWKKECILEGAVKNIAKKDEIR